VTAPVVFCHGDVAPDRDEARGKTRYRCGHCGRDLVLHDDLLGQLFSPLIDDEITEVPLPMLITAAQRTRR
jgi:hypothetical protein